MSDDRIKPNFSEIARQTGISRQTLAKHWNKSRKLSADIDGRKTKEGKYDKYDGEILEKFSGNCTISAVFHYFKNKYPKIFVSYEGFRYHVQSKGMVSKKTSIEAHVRYETDAAEQIQVDWKENIKAILCDGLVIVFNLYVLVFSYSRKRFLCIAFQKTTEEFIRCTIETLQRAGGCPEYLLTDNMSAIVNHSTNELIEPIKKFLGDMGFDIKRCRPFAPFTKGKVESVNRYIQWLAPYQGEIKNVSHLYQIISIIETQINEEPNETTGFAPDFLFDYEKKKLKQLPKKELMDLWMKARKTTVPNTLLISCQGKQYSTPLAFKGKTVQIIPCSNSLYIYSGLDVIRVHDMNQDGKFHYDEQDYVEGIASRMVNIGKDQVEEQARKNLERLSRIGRKEDGKYDGCGQTGDTERQS